MLELIYLFEIGIYFEIGYLFEIVQIKALTHTVRCARE